MSRHYASMSLGQALKAETETRGISYRRAAELVGASPPTFSKWVTDEHRPGAEWHAPIAKFLHLRVEDVRKMRANGRGSLEDRMTSIEDELAELRKAITRLLAGQQ